jgi:FlaA1/EpsC-like NDP-sugar epimerase/EAL domain-containing protein (putative c-di-GMP-specific phosphodiesterase class I)
MFNNLDEKLLNLNNRHFFIIDAIIFLFTPFVALTLRMDGLEGVQPYQFRLLMATILFSIVKLTVFVIFGFYRRYWRYASIEELAQIAILSLVSLVVEIILLNILYLLPSLGIDPLPRSLPFLDSLLSLIFVGGVRFSVRAGEKVGHKKRKYCRRDRVLVIGAGDTGVSLVQEMQRNPQLGLLPVAFVDDDPQKLNLKIRGISVAGNRHQIPEIARFHNIRKAIVAMPTAPGKVIREIVDLCQATGIKTSTLPGMHEILNNRDRVSLGILRDVNIEDLLRREPIQTDVQSVFRFLGGKTVLITGAGGSIGSELCRQIFRCHPAEIVLMGHGENSVFNIQQELEQYIKILKQDEQDTAKIPRLTAAIADLRSFSRLNYLFERYKPDIVFHAAAHKHVPLMELNSPEAITNNVLGTKNLLDLAAQHQVEHFVMVSSDKAVNPTNVMGASKRVAEMLVLQAARASGRHYVVVRFGNVLGSRGSVVPTFQRQIAKGGPITITHPDISRYFMTIPEAVQLVLQASVLARSGGEIFMLNMGQPVKIVDLAKDLIRLSGYEVGKDIDIVFTGLRPGEKLYEELLIAGEEYQPTEHKKILVVNNATAIISDKLDMMLDALYRAAAQNEQNSIFFLLEQLVSGYKPKYPEGSPATNIQKKIEQVLASSAPKFNFNGKDPKAIVAKEPTAAELERELLQARKHDQLCLYYQPIIHFETSKLIGFEALLRWHHPQWGIIPAQKFMTLAERLDILEEINFWVIDEACRQLSIWQEDYTAGQSLIVGINISSQELLTSNLVKHLKENIYKNVLDPHSLRLEICEKALADCTTRTGIASSMDSSMTAISQLKRLGVQLQVDNFGKTHCIDDRSYSFPNFVYEQFDRLKIDRKLIGKMVKDNDSLAIVKEIASNARNSGIELMAAGVETPEQLAHLIAMRCRYGQGYLFSQPIASEEVKRLIGV